LAGILLAGCANRPFPEAVEKGNITIRYLTEDPKTLDPSVSYTTLEAPITSLISPAFYRYRFYSRQKYDTELNLGAAMPTVEKLTPAKKGDAVERWTYRIRHDLRYQDDPCFKDGKGRAITAQDIVYSFQRMADASVNCPVSSFVSDKIVGWEEDSKRFDKDKSAYDKPMRGVYVDPKDPYAFIIELNQPYPQLKYLMAMSFTAPQPREAVEKYGDQYGLHHPISCGPYYLKEYVPRDHMLLWRNPNAPKEIFPTEADPEFADVKADFGKPTPFLDGIYLAVMQEAVTNYNLFQQGYFDTLGVSAANASIVPAANGLTQEMKDRGIKLNKNVGLSVDYMGFNMEDALVGGYTPEKRKLRQAISLAVDSGRYIDVITQGMAEPSHWIIPPGLAGYDPKYQNPYRLYDPKLTKAKQLLAEAGYPNGVDSKTGQRLTVIYDNYATTSDLKQIVRLHQSMIEQLGIKVELRTTTYAEFQDKVNKRQVQMFGFGWNADYPDAENFTFLLYGPNAAPGPNATNYNNPEYNKLFEQMRSMTDSPARLAIIQKMRDLSVEDCPWIYVDYPATRTLVQPWVKNNYSSPIANDLLKYVRVDPQQRITKQAEWNRSSLLPVVGLVGGLVLLCIPAATTIRNRTNRRLRKDGAKA
jgi:ABC-type transport system substrate-binding protein